MKKLLHSSEIELMLQQQSYSEVLSILKEKYNFNHQCIMYTKNIDNKEHQNYNQYNVYEIIYLDKGEILYTVENKNYTLESGDFLLLPPNTKHKIKDVYENNGEPKILVFDEKYIRKFNTEFTDLTLLFEKVKNTDNHQIKIREAFKNRINSSFNFLEELFLSNEYGDDILFDATFASLIVRMNKDINFYGIDSYYKNYSDLFKKVNNYINDNIDKKILLKDIAKHVGISESRLSHIYKEELGTSILQYIINKRLIIAKDLLKIGTSISEISYRCGFPDYSSFLRAFKKKFGISPKVYQKQYFLQQ